MGVLIITFSVIFLMDSYCWATSGIYCQRESGEHLVFSFCQASSAILTRTDYTDCSRVRFEFRWFIRRFGFTKAHIITLFMQSRIYDLVLNLINPKVRLSENEMLAK